MFMPSDLYLGAKLVMAATGFVITGTDSFTLNYMEAHAEDWTYSDIRRVQFKLQLHKAAVQAVLMNFVRSPDGKVSFKEFNQLMKRAGVEWNQQVS